MWHNLGPGVRLTSAVSWALLGEWNVERAGLGIWAGGHKFVVVI